ncbi:MAG: choice-of-anchor B family protein [Proteobacteria bacterium]|nr:choice-of-anchor B family protein [Pseudomonadota bacterium]
MFRLVLHFVLACATIGFGTFAAAATSCVGGFAGIYPCNNVDLLAHIPDYTTSGSAADVWGFMDLNSNREYVIVGYDTGTAVFDVTDAENPREVGFIDGESTIWRDVKIHQFWNTTDNRWNAYAYVSAEDAADGLLVIDLTQLPHRVAQVGNAGNFPAAHNVHLTKSEFSTGLSLTGDSPTLILAGSNLSDGRFRSYSLANPAEPVFVAAPATPADQPVGDPLYMHDAASMIVTDARKDTQCVNASSSDYCDVLFDFNESTFDIWDVTIPASPVRLSRTPYNNARYVHSGWSSEDGQYLFVQDEADELNLGLATTVRIFSISNLTAPTLAGTWTGPTSAIDHNSFVRGNRLYLSNYTRGLTILDITDSSNPVAAGRFDTYPSSDAASFSGAWGAYPFLPSGNIAISDADSGFFMVADKSLAAAQGSLSFTAAAFGNDETLNVAVAVQRTGGSQGAVSVDWEIIGATGSFADVTTTSGTLSWTAGDAANQIIGLSLTNDGVAEGLERVLIKLTAPTGGATLSSPSIASVYISDPGNTPVVEFSSASISVDESGFGMAIAIVQRTGSAIGAISVDFTLSNGDATAGADYTGPASGTLAWADGDADPKWIEYSIVDDGEDEADEFFELLLGNASGGSIGPVAQLRINIIGNMVTNDPPPVVHSGGGSASLWLLLALLLLSAPGAARLATTRTDVF